MPSVEVIRRTDYIRGHIQILGWELDDDGAAELVAEGRGHYEQIEVPSQIYLLRNLEIRGIVHLAGSLLQIDGEITAQEALALMRGRTGRNEPHAIAPGGGVG
jgi:hypothetical protein